MGSSDVVVQHARALAELDAERAVANIGPALKHATRIGQQFPWHAFGTVVHRASEVERAAAEREELLDLFADADRARSVLACALVWDPPDRDVAGAMISALLAWFGAKPDRAVLGGMLLALGSDEFGFAEPLRLSSPILAMACRKLLVTNTFVPRPSELHAACLAVRRQLEEALRAADRLTSHVQKLDAVLLEFRRDLWVQPYLTEEFAPILDRMLSLHSIFGDGSRGFDGAHAFAALVRAEQQKLPQLTKGERL